VISDDELEMVASTIDPDLMNDEIQPRIDRYQSPPTEVTIEANEPAFDTVGFESVAGTPLRPHELDLNGTVWAQILLLPTAVQFRRE